MMKALTKKKMDMGPDLVYSFNSEDCYECPECATQLKIEGWIREYQWERMIRKI